MNYGVILAASLFYFLRRDGQHGVSKYKYTALNRRLAEYLMTYVAQTRRLRTTPVTEPAKLLTLKAVRTATHMARKAPLLSPIRTHMCPTSRHWPH